MSLHVLLIDDHTDALTTAAARLETPRPRFQPIRLTVARTWKAARTRIVCNAFDVIVMRSEVRDATALEMLEALRILPHPPVVVLTPDADLDVAMKLLRAGADDCVMQHLRDWEVELHLAIERLAGPAQRMGRNAEAVGGLNEYGAVLAALLLRRQSPYTAGVLAAGN